MPERNILVVEDDVISGAYIQNLLERLGYRAPEVLNTGEAAVERAIATRPDLVLMDIGLAGDMDGVAAATEIRKATGTPVVYLTALSDEPTLEKARVTEPFGFISKPFHEQVLQMAIEIAIYRHDMETRMRENEQWLTTVLAGIGDAVIATDPKGRIRFMNPVASELTGWDQESALGLYLDEVFLIMSGETGTPVPSPVTRAIREKATVRLENHVVLVQRDGRTVPIEDAASPIWDENGQVTGVVMVFRDNSAQVRDRREREDHAVRLGQEVDARTRELAEANERLRSEVAQRCTAEEAARAAEEKYRVLVEHANVGICASRGEEILFANRPLVRSLGYRDMQEVAGIPLRDHVAPAYREAFLAGMRARQEGRVTGPVVREFGLLHKDGSVRVHEVAVCDVNIGGEVQYLATLRDLTETRRLQKRLVRSESVAAVSRLTASVAREIGAPLAGACRLAGELRAMHENSPETVRSLEQVLEILTGLRETAAALTSAAGDHSRERGRLDLRQCLGRAMDLTADTAERLAVRLEPGASGPELPVEGSTDQLVQVFWNLVENAAHAAARGSGPPAVSVDVRKEGGEAVVTVSDNGPGIPGRDMPLLFDPFFTRKPGGGMGLGLFVCRAVVEEHGGSIQAENRPEGGARFTVRLPLAK